jgi:hypothetical protein
MNPHKGYLCLNEIELGAPLRPAMTAIFREKLGGGTLRKLILEAHRFKVSSRLDVEVIGVRRLIGLLKALEALEEGIVDSVGGLDETLAFIEEFQLVKKAQPGATGKSVYGELKLEMWRNAVDHLTDMAAEARRDEETRERVMKERQRSLKNVESWERAKPKL